MVASARDSNAHDHAVHRPCRAVIPSRMTNRILGLALALALISCKKDEKKKDEPRAEGKPATPEVVAADAAKAAPPAAPDAAPAAPADPTASWTEQKGDGFTVKAARTPQQESSTQDTPLGPQAVTMYFGYEPDGFEGSFQAA